MANGYSLRPKLQKGALIELSEPFLGPVPNIIVFQYNPETLSRNMTLWSSSAKGSGTEGAEMQSTEQPIDPVEEFTLSLILDATDELEKPTSHPVAMVSGVANRIAALEMLLYPMKETLLGEAFSNFMGANAVPRGEVPIVLFVWGPARVLPVRIRSFSVEEQAFSTALYPIRATVSVGLRVLTPEAFGTGREDSNGKPKLSVSEELAVKAYQFTRGQKEILARTNLINSVESVMDQVPSEITGMLGL